MGKKFNEEINEEKIYSYWKKNKFFEPLKNNKKYFSILMPPPNVTGHLHLGHAWDNLIPDLIWRTKRLSGFNPVWLPGTDHAGIATQAKYEGIIKKQGIDKSKLTEAQFLKGLYNWAKEQADYIHMQWQKLGLSLSYDSETFTLDKNVYDIIYDEFIQLYNDKLIYRDNKLVNWDIKLQTAISDVEVEYKETKSQMYYFKYYLENNNKEYLVIATTRPETMFADTNVFINPTDKRYTKYLGKKVINPINDELLPILADKYIDINFGTGVMKCTPAHDFNDYQLAKKYKIDKYQSTMNLDGTLNKLANTKYGNYEGMDRLKARPLIIENFKKRNLIEKIEDHTNNVGYSQRSGEIVEPLLSLQWFVKMKPILQQLQTMLKKDKVFKLFPSRFNSNLKHWFDNMQDWCISRQLLWGHQIPAWYNKKTNAIYVGKTAPKDSSNWIKEKDVLDTWFSSGLWPLALTKYHPHKLKHLYPISFLYTGYDILTFWVSRMLFQCSYIDKTIPINHVVLHGLIRDENNQKMSKTLGNVIDPMDVIKEYGSDTLRLFLISATTNSGEDIKFSMEKVKYYWTFINKIWNASALVTKQRNIDPKKLSFISQYTINELEKCKAKIIENIDQYNFGVATKYLIDFCWETFCNKYLEMRDIIGGDESKKVISYIYQQILIIGHGFAPFTTQYLYDKIYKGQILNQEIVCNKISKDIIEGELFFELFKIVKAIRIKYGIKKDHPLNFNISTNIKYNKDLLKQYFSKLNIVYCEKMNNKECISEKTNNMVVNILNDFSKKNEEDTAKTLTYLENEIKRSEGILNNKAFLAKAPKEKVEEEKKKYANYLKQYQELKNK